MDPWVELQPKVWISNETGVSPTVSVRAPPWGAGENLDATVASGADENIEVVVIL
jgi:hypothetical protein